MTTLPAADSFHEWIYEIIEQVIYCQNVHMLPYGYLLFATQFYDACGLEVQTTIKPSGGEALKGLYSHWPVSKTWGGKASQVGPGLHNDVY